MVKLIIVRGAPGSGKSTLAHEIAAQAFGMMKVCEADDFFIRNGVYNFNASKLGQAHESCYENVERELRSKRPCIVSNTFTKDWELRKYLELSKELDIPTVVIQCHGKFKNVHGVPEEKVMQMRSRSWSQAQLREVFKDEFPNVEYVNYDTHTQMAQDQKEEKNAATGV